MQARMQDHSLAVVGSRAGIEAHNCMQNFHMMVSVQDLSTSLLLVDTKTLSLLVFINVILLTAEALLGSFLNFL